MTAKNTRMPSNAAARAFYRDAVRQLSSSSIPFLVGGAFAFIQYLEIERETKDLDLFLRRADLARALTFFREAGYRAELPFPHWLGKVFCGEHFIDVIFSSGNGLAAVDDAWFEHAVEKQVLGLPVRLCPPEEMIWSKAFVQERDRFDGADVLHLIKGLGPTLDWHRLLVRFGPHWRVLFSHLVLFGFVYPNQRRRIPSWVLDDLTGRFVNESPDPENRLCNGTLLSREQYLHDVEQLGYRDARIEPIGRMTREETEIWTAAIADHTIDSPDPCSRREVEQGAQATTFPRRRQRTSRATLSSFLDKEP